jgi:hypothetical protein
MVLTDTGSWRVIWALPARWRLGLPPASLRRESRRAVRYHPARHGQFGVGKPRPASRPGGLGHLDGLRQYLLGPGRLAAAAQEAAVAVQGSRRARPAPMS